MQRPQLALPFPGELIIDNFAGGGGTSTGLEAAFGRPVDIAINHDPEALAMHALNHPHRSDGEPPGGPGMAQSRLQAFLEGEGWHAGFQAHPGTGMGGDALGGAH
nr:hypothetical protein [Ideonella dechloratans]